MAQFDVSGIDFQATEYEVATAIANVVHSEEFFNADDPKARKMNLRVSLNKPPERNGYGHDGTGKLSLPTRLAADKFQKWYRIEGNNVKVSGKKLRFFRSGKPGPGLTEELQKAPWIDPAIEEEMKRKNDELKAEAIRVRHLQFGIFYNKIGFSQTPTNPNLGGKSSYSGATSKKAAKAGALLASSSSLATSKLQTNASSLHPASLLKPRKVAAVTSSIRSAPPMHGIKIKLPKQNKKQVKADKENGPPSPSIDPLPAEIAPTVFEQRTVTRCFSVESNSDCSQHNAAWLRISFIRKAITVEIGSPVTSQYRDTVIIKFDNIISCAMGSDMGNPFICFDLRTAVILEREEFYLAKTEDDAEKMKKYRDRLISLHEEHERVAPYATSVRLLLVEHQDLDIFTELCGTAELRLPETKLVEANRENYFSLERLRRIKIWAQSVDWTIAFQIEALLHNCLVNTTEIFEIELALRAYDNRGIDFIADLLRSLVEALQAPTRSQGESALECFNRVLRLKSRAGTHPLVTQPGMFPCCHVTVTPTRLILEGPYATQSNRVVRMYPDHRNHFIRVDFRDEDRLQYRWDREVDGRLFLQKRVGEILKNGFELGGRWWCFLAYSTSALREHSVWFMNPFQMVDGTQITAESIRAELGDFSGVINHPSKYAARMAQAFTATDPSVHIRREEWDEMPDLGRKPYEHTDGVGTISPELADRIWAKMREDDTGPTVKVVKPSAYQIRFLGYKGMVAVDDQLTGIKMRLRPSMNKFRALDPSGDAEIEIARAFPKPMSCNLNRSLIMILEDRGVRKEKFMDIQNRQVTEIKLCTADITRFHSLLSSHNLGKSYHLGHIVQQLRDRGLDFIESDTEQYVDSVFLHRIVGFAIHHTLRDIKHGARIPLEDSWLLPGIIDEGPAHANEGMKDLFMLEDKQIFACVQGPHDEKPRYIKGHVIIWRSPTVHPGDVQRVYAVGEPPRGKTCIFRNIKNAVVLPGQGERSLASMLGGGDVDGDLFCISADETLLTQVSYEPAKYQAAEPILLDRPSTIDDVCDFVVDYIDSDVLGLLSDKHLTIADQSKEGTMDLKCLKLAELCSLAVDYQKSGVRVNIQDAPRALIRFKPDWHAAEVVRPRKIDYYTSERAIGHMYRAIDLPTLAYRNKDLPSTLGANMTDRISIVLLKDLRKYLPKLQPTNEEPDWLKKMFERYLNEFRYICATHTLTSAADSLLTEEEVVIGTILAQCAQKRWRKDRMFRMSFHSGVLFRNTQKELLDYPRLDNAPDAAERARIKTILIDGLDRAWTAWCFSVRFSPSLGANSFGLVALHTAFDALNELAGCV